MTAITTFIGDCVKGGFKGTDELYPFAVMHDGQTTPQIEGTHTLMGLEELLLIPDAWRAVGKVREWKRGIDPETGEETMADPSDTFAQAVWEDNMHRFIDSLCGGHDIESALKSLEK